MSSPLSATAAGKCHTVRVFVTLNHGSRCNSHFGHAGIGVGNEYYDWGPVDEKSNFVYYLFGERGRPYDDILANSSPERRARATVLDVREFLRGRKPDIRGDRNFCQAFEVVARIQEREAQLLRHYWDFIYEREPYFHVLKNQCANLAFASLRYAGLLKRGRAILFPSTLLSRIRNELVSTCGSEGGRGAKVIELRPRNY